MRCTRPPLHVGTLLFLLLIATSTSVLAGEAQGTPPADPPAATNPHGRVRPARVYTTQRLEGPAPTIDGRLDDEAWRLGEWSGDYVQQLPIEGAAPSHPAELKILYDERHVYVAIRAYDDPAKIHRYPARRDQFGGDIVGICFDSYFDKRTGFEFDLNAAGSKLDLVLTNEGWDTSWDAVWHGKVALEADAWTAEFQIPLSQLRYGTQDTQVWGLHAWRWINRLQEESQWNLIPRNSTGRMYNLGELQGIRGLPRSRRIELLPHTVGKVEAQPTVPGNPYRTGADGGGSAGLDAKIGLTSDFTLDATINPDFGQVEADPSVVNLTTYETFFEEKRPFFVEGKSIFAFNLEASAVAGDAAVSAGDMLFYSRRLGDAPTYAPPLLDGESIDAPQRTSILSAVKVSGKTSDGLSVAVLHSVTGAEHARISFDGAERRQMVEPAAQYVVGRVQKDWDKGNTILGGMFTSTHRWIPDDELSFLPGDALTGGLDFVQFLRNRSYVLEARGVFSRLTGTPDALRAVQGNPVHYFQRPDADHLTFAPDATTLDGHGGTVRFGRYGNSKWRYADSLRWMSPGLDLNDAGYLRQADEIRNEASAGYEETDPRGPFRTYGVRVAREDTWDFGGLHTAGTTTLEAQGSFTNKWQLSAALRASEAPIDTRMLRGGPAMTRSALWGVSLDGSTDSSRRVVGMAGLTRHTATEGRSHATSAYTGTRLRITRAFTLFGQVSYERNLEDLQYVDTVHSSVPRYVLGRIDQDTLSATFRADLHITPELSVQYYGSPFVSTGRYDRLRRAADTRAADYASRFHLYGPDEIAYRPGVNAYEVQEEGDAYRFDNPDFSFREFRSNLVARWEFRPGSSLYLVWSQGRTSMEDRWDGSLADSLDALWRAAPTNVVLVKISYWFSL